MPRASAPAGGRAVGVPRRSASAGRPARAARGRHGRAGGGPSSRPGRRGGRLTKVSAEEYDTLAEVYEWLVPDALLTPEGSVAALAAVVDTLAPGARILD